MKNQITFILCLLIINAKASYIPKRLNTINNINNNKHIFWLTTSTTKTPDNFCIDKEDDGLYEHDDCKKYWHCLYVGTIFQSAVERKCPIGTMFHPLMSQCEISTVVRINYEI
jgi:hypothetical protein